MESSISTTDRVITNKQLESLYQALIVSHLRK